ncbi:ABC-2 type transport system permease protein [Kroppenstedtia eburnea]|uniref:ABC-2 type transport system permease protein n=1 Tax=Kroppenstedtia eburnea TaxID=714067 RepID=A0A1N7ISD9_9BACL|nr:ABC-2 type transport system permease protein [Kroppenstedtia eburnea]
MTDLLRLVKTEGMKVLDRTRTWVFLMLLVLLSFLFAMGRKWMENTTGWEENMGGFVLDSSSLLFVVQLLTVVIAGEIVSSEFAWGTVKLLLIRPVNRTKVLYSKYMVVLCFSLLCMAVLFLSSMLFGAVLFRVYSPEGMVLLRETGVVYGLRWVEIVMVATMAFMLSTLSRSSSLGVGLSIFLVFAGMMLVEGLKMIGISLGKYLLFANLDLTQYLEGAIPAFSGMTPGFSIGILSVYFLLFHLISWLSFVKRDISI